MANEQSKRERAAANRAYLKMRSDYRASLVELPFESDPADFADGAKTILHGPRLFTNQKLTVKIPRWTGTPPPTGSDVVELLLDKGDGNGFVKVDEHTFTRPSGQPDFAETFPYPMEISAGDLPRDESCELKYHIYYYNGSDDGCDPVTFYCDQVKPYNGDAPAALTLTNPLLDDTNLPAGGKLELTLPPGYEGGSPAYEWRAGDWIFVYLVDANAIPEDPSKTTPIYAAVAPDPGTAGAKVEIDADKIRALGDTEGVFIYVLRDTALNDSVVSLWTKVSLTFGSLPTGLTPPTVPQADPGPLLFEHAMVGVSVWIDRYTGFKNGDSVELTWGSTVVVKDFYIPDNGSQKFEVPVPSRDILLEYGATTTGAKDTAVSYRVFRKGRPFVAPSTTIKVNFEVAIPWLPWPPEEGWPNPPLPIHPSLLLGEVQNHDRTRFDELTRADKNEDAFFVFTWYAEAVNGHVVDFYWNGTLVTEAKLTFDDTASPGPGHKPGEEVEVVIPWARIQDGKNGPSIPVQYSISKAGLENDLPSPITSVDVNAITIELPPASFPSIPSGTWPNCKSLEANGDLRVAIPDLSALLKNGDKIHVVFTPMTGEDLSDPEAPIKDAEFEDDFVLGTDGEITGFEFLVTPYATHIQPLYDDTGATSRRGRMKIQYFFNDGTEDIGSEPLTLVTAFHDGSGACPITP
ncbi:hypothetical protein [Pseudomonas sp. C32]|uniref:hypothetical protein n=1 Tax=Pseudomonas sp. C32 TaxID=1529208 RepID=UPI00263A2AE1|nr:hypothetical protein [Pseudomonas sp. C32]MDN4547482.1 hypothetical protein [Pseudomonas sp. C32]